MPWTVGASDVGASGATTSVDMLACEVLAARSSADSRLLKHGDIELCWRGNDMPRVSGRYRHAAPKNMKRDDLIR
jgi:hypothetical protein